ncbi:squalene cyclase [Tessaracoccus sp. Z1128]
MRHDSELIGWLLDTDPALRWQVQRDLVGEPEDVWQATRAQMAGTGMAARLLALQDDDGQWAGGAYFPTRADPRAVNHDDDDEGQPYTATTWTLNTLREWGLDASALAGTAEKLAANSRWEYDDLPYWGGEVDCCINAFTLANGAWLGADVSGLAEWFLEHQLDDGGWNCEWVEGSGRSSFHSTLNSLRGMLWYERAVGGHDALKAARQRAHEYLLERRLMYRLSTGERVGDWVGYLAYPLRWVYSVLNVLDYLRQASVYDGVSPDPRAAEAVEVVRAARKDDGRWLQGGRYKGQVWFEIDVPKGQPSPWLTFYATRMLHWWDGEAAATTLPD